MRRYCIKCGEILSPRHSNLAYCIKCAPLRKLVGQLLWYLSDIIFELREIRIRLESEDDI